VVSTGVRDLLWADDREQLKVTSTGVKAFERQEIKASRVCVAARRL
jgi:hypothetical protein